MKRALIVLPLLAILLGLLLFVLHRTQGPNAPARATAGAGDTAESPPTAETKKPFAASNVVDPTLTGAVRFIVTHRGQPIKDVTITAQKEGTPDFMKFKTEPDGTQLLRGMPAVPFSFFIEHPDYVPQTADLAVVADKTTELRVDLKRGGRVYGTVTDPSGRPVPDARIFLLGVYGEGRPIPMPGTAVQSDEKGQYQIKAISAGTYGIRFRHKRYEPLDRLDLTFSAPTDEYRIDVVLTPGARITGRVVDEQGKPIAGAHVMASNIESAMTERTDQDGNFDLGGLFHKPANCQASMKGYGKVIKRNLPVDGPPVEFRLAKAGALMGRVIVDVPLPEFQIVLHRYDEDLKQVVPFESKQFQKSPGNVFSMEDIPPGTYWVEIQVEGYEAVDRPQVQIVGGQITEGVTITLRKKN
jgi:hypothetical protein